VLRRSGSEDPRGARPAANLQADTAVGVCEQFVVHAEPGARWGAKLDAGPGLDEERRRGTAGEAKPGIEMDGQRMAMLRADEDHVQLTVARAGFRGNRNVRSGKRDVEDLDSKVFAGTVSTPSGGATHDTEPDFTALEPHIRMVLETLIPEATARLLNVNLPPIPRGMTWTRQAVRHYDGHVVPGEDPMGR
jgi:hypothetical protein